MGQAGKPASQQRSASVPVAPRLLGPAVFPVAERVSAAGSRSNRNSLEITSGTLGTINSRHGQQGIVGQAAEF